MRLLLTITILVIVASALTLGKREARVKRKELKR